MSIATIIDEKYNKHKLKLNVLESIENNEDALAILSTLNLDEVEMSYIVSLFEYIKEEDVDSVLDILVSLFKDKVLSPVDSTLEAETETADSMNDNNTNNSTMVSERYTKILLGDY